MLKRAKVKMLPGIKDGLDGFQAIKYNLGFSKEKAQNGIF